MPTYFIQSTCGPYSRYNDTLKLDRWIRGPPFLLLDQSQWPSLPTGSPPLEPTLVSISITRASLPLLILGGV